MTVALGKSVPDFTAPSTGGDFQLKSLRGKTVVLSKINEVIHKAQDAHPHPTHAGRQLKMFYGTQVRSDPPTFMIYVNDPKLMHFTY